MSTTTGEDRRGLDVAHAGIEVRAGADGGAARFHGHAAVFDERTAIGDPFTWGFYEEIAPGAFAATLRGGDQRKLIDHDPYYVVSRVSAGTLQLREDARGLAVDSALDTRLSYVNDLVTNLDNRNITGMSFGFYVDGPNGDQWTTEEVRDASGRARRVEVRRLLALVLPEVSSVTFPAYQATDGGVRAEDEVRAVGLALGRRADAGAQFEARSRHCPELGRYFQREAITVNRPRAGAAEPRTAPAARRVTAPGLPAHQGERRDLLRSAGSGGRGFRIENRAGDDDAPAEVLIYDVIGWFGCEAEEVVRQLAEITADRITVRINSPGGDVYDGIAILNALRGHDATVTTLVEGLAASAASFIAMAGDEVVMCRNAEMMVHEAWGICIGDAADMRELAGRLDKIGDNLASIYAAKAGGTVEQWRAAMHAETWYSADEAVEAGLADRVRDSDPAPSEADDDPDPDDQDPGDQDSADDRQALARWDLSAFTYPGRRAAPGPVLRRSSTDPGAEHTAPEPDWRARRMDSLTARFGRS